MKYPGPLIFRKVIPILVKFTLMPLLFMVNSSLLQAQEIKAEWMRGGFGVGFNYRAGDESKSFSDVGTFDVQAAVDQVASIDGVGWVLFNLTSTAFGDRLLAPLPLLEEVNPLAVPSRDLFGELVDAYQAKGIRVIAYVATQGPAMLKHGAEKANDYDGTIANSTCKKTRPETGDADKTVYCSRAMNRWRDKVLELYKGKGSLHSKFEKAMAEKIIRPLSIRYGDKIDGWWFDHADYGHIPRLRAAALAGNANAVIAFNQGQKIPLTNNNPGLEDYTFGHPNPMAMTPPQDNINLPIIESIEDANRGVFYGPNGEASLGHMFLPIQEVWYSGQVVFSENKGSEWSERILNAGGALTWSVALQGAVAATETSPAVPAGVLMEEAQVKLIKRINYNRGKQLHLMLDGKSNHQTLDTSGNRRTANASATAFSIDQERGYVGQFNHSAITVPGYKGVNGSAARSVGAWIKTTSSTGKIVQWGSNSQSKRWWLQLSKGKVAVLIHGASIIGSELINDDQWHYVVVTSANSSLSKVKIYVDGVLDENTVTNNPNNIRINTTAGGDVQIGDQFSGQLDDITVHNRVLSSGAVAYAASTQTNVDLELALRLSLDEPSGATKVVDGSIYGRSGVHSNTNLGFEDQVRGTVAEFNGSSYIEIAPNTDLTLNSAAALGFNGIPGEEPRTIMGWVKTSTSKGDLVQYGHYDSAIGGEIWRMSIVNNALRLNVKGGTVKSRTSITDNQWHHFAVVASDNKLNNVKIYIDGKLEKTTLSGSESSFDTYTSNSSYNKETKALTLNSKNVRLGMAGFIGYLDDVIMHQRALQPYEIKHMAGL